MESGRSPGSAAASRDDCTEARDKRSQSRPHDLQGDPILRKVNLRLTISPRIDGEDPAPPKLKVRTEKQKPKC